MVELKGLEKFAPKDFPGYISATVFLSGCNFRTASATSASSTMSRLTLRV